MNKFKQCTYTVILLVTCFIASPMIFKQIWKTSAEKKKESHKIAEEVDITKGMASPEAPIDPAVQPPTEVPYISGDTSVTTVLPEVTDIPAAEIATTTTTAAPAGYSYVKSDYSYFEDALFIGDSRTVGIEKYGSLGNADFFCDVGLTTLSAYSSSVDGDLSDMLYSNNYGKVYIMLGINEIGNDFSTTFSNYRKLVETIHEKSPDAVIYLQANLHVTANAEDGSINNERINTLNAMIQGLADYKKTFYIDINPVFDDDYGNLRSDCTDDGVHVYAKFYTQWSDWYCLYTVPEQPTAPLQPIDTPQAEP